MKSNLAHIISFLLLFVTVSGYSQQEKIELQKGNIEHYAMRYQNALTHYDSSITINPSYFYGTFNSGNSFYRISQSAKDSLKIAYAEKSADRFESALFSTENRKHQSLSYYNEGNCYLSVNQLKESIESYKNALRKDPTNKNARYNLSYALLKLKAQEEAMNDIQKQIDSLQNEIDKTEEEKKENEASKKPQQQKEQKKSELEKKQEELERKKKELEDKKKQGEKSQESKPDENGKKEESKQGDKSEEKEGKEKGGKEDPNGDKSGNKEKGQMKRESFTIREAKQNLDALKNEEKKVLMRINKRREAQQKKRDAGSGTREEKDW